MLRRGQGLLIPYPMQEDRKRYPVRLHHNLANPDEKVIILYRFVNVIRRKLPSVQMNRQRPRQLNKINDLGASLGS